jgi:hypothetical protein
VGLFPSWAILAFSCFKENLSFCHLVPLLGRGWFTKIVFIRTVFQQKIIIIYHVTAIIIFYSYAKLKMHNGQSYTNNDGYVSGVYFPLTVYKILLYKPQQQKRKRKKC